MRRPSPAVLAARRAHVEAQERARRWRERTALGYIRPAIIGRLITEAAEVDAWYAGEHAARVEQEERRAAA